MNVLAIGIGAGLVSALLFGVVITGSPLAMLLSYVAPLPILIAALGWSHRSGLIAAVVGGLATGYFFRFEAGIAFALGSGLPAWWLAYLGLLGRADADGTMEWYPLGRLLLWLAGIAAAVTLAGVLALGDGSDEGYQGNLRQALDAVLRAGNAAPTPPADAAAPAENPLLDALVAAVPFVAAAVFALVFTLNLWLAAKVVQMSQRLPRPWPFIPATALPRVALPLLGLGFVASFLPGLVGVAGLCLAGALMIAFAFQGLAFLHEATRGRSGRTAMLSATYVLVFFVGHTVLPVLALVGVADTAMSLRSRFGSGKAGPRLPS